MKVAIIDDDVMYIRMLEDIMQRERKKYDISEMKMSTFLSGEDFLEQWNAESYDLIFIDIFMKDITGIDVAREVRKRDIHSQIVFCTTSNDFASQSYEVDASYYLKKPFSEQAVDQMLQKININKMKQNQMTMLPNGEKIPIHSVMYTEYVNHKVYVHFIRNHSIELRMSMMDTEEIFLRYSEFVKINRGNIINMNMILTLNRDGVKLKNGEVLAISRARFKDVSSDYAKFKIKKIVASR